MSPLPPPAPTNRQKSNSTFIQFVFERYPCEKFSVSVNQFFSQQQQRMCHSQIWKRRSLFLAATALCPLSPLLPHLLLQPQQIDRRVLDSSPGCGLSLRDIFGRSSPSNQFLKGARYSWLQQHVPSPLPPGPTNRQESIAFCDCISQ